MYTPWFKRNLRQRSVVYRASAWRVQSAILLQQFVRLSVSHALLLLYMNSAVAEMGDRARAKWAEKWGGGCCAPFRTWGEEAGSPSSTAWPGRRPTSIPSGILIHLTVWPQYTNVTDRTDRQRSRSIGRTVLQTVESIVTQSARCMVARGTLVC